jgi:hypothetical protein
MMARIYKPARTAMQSGEAKTKEWVLEYELFKPKPVERRGISYADNFAVNRRDPWTH